MESIISTYGYVAITIGTFFEGETVLALGGFAAHQGYLKLPWVITSGFLRTLLGDQLFFILVASKGQKFWRRSPIGNQNPNECLIY